MNKVKSSFRFISILIITNPIIDMLFTILGENKLGFISINQLIRLVIFFIALFFIRTKESKTQTVFLTIILFFIIVMQNAIGVTGSLMSDIGFAIKILLGFIFFRIVYDEQKNDKFFIQRINKSIRISTIIILLNIFLAVLGLGKQTYSGGGGRMTGYLGFISGNLIAANSLVVLFSYHLFMSFRYKKKSNIILSVGSFLGLFLLASKFSIFASLLILVIVYLIFAFNSKSYTKKKMIIIGILISIGSLGILIPYLIKYISAIQDDASKYGYDFLTALTTNRFMQIEIVEGYHVGRLKVDLTICRLFGVSYSHTNEVLNDIKSDFYAIELDFHGIYYYLGGIFLAITILFFALLIFKGLRYYTRMNIGGKISLFVVVLLLLGAFLGGHVLYELTTLIYFALPCSFVLASCPARKKRKKKMVKKVLIRKRIIYYEQQDGHCISQL